MLNADVEYSSKDTTWIRLVCHCGVCWLWSCLGLFSTWSVSLHLTGISLRRVKLGDSGSVVSPLTVVLTCRISYSQVRQNVNPYDTVFTIS